MHTTSQSHTYTIYHIHSISITKPSSKMNPPSKSGSPTQARSLTQKPKEEGSSTQLILIKPELSTQEFPKNQTLKQTKADYAFPIETLLALQEIGLTKLPKKTWADIASKSDDGSKIDLQALIQKTKESKVVCNPLKEKKIIDYNIPKGNASPKAN